MKTLGIRCSNRDFSYALLDGSKDGPVVIMVNSLAFPTGFKPAQSLNWLYQEIRGLINTHSPSIIVVKRFEGRSRGSAFELRVEHEAAVMLAAAHVGPTPIFKKMSRTIAKDLGLKGKTSYLKTRLDRSLIPDLDEYPKKVQDAILAAWSELS